MWVVAATEGAGCESIPSSRHHANKPQYWLRVRRGYCCGVVAVVARTCIHVILNPTSVLSASAWMPTERPKRKICHANWRLQYLSTFVCWSPQVDGSVGRSRYH